MNRKLKLAIVALLGLSTACSSVGKGPKDSKKDNKKETIDPRPVVMYGVRPPVKTEGVMTKDDAQKQRIAEDVEPVVEDIKEE